MGKSDRSPGLEPVRTFPYYKLQVWEDAIGAWKDIQRKFRSLADVQASANEHRVTRRQVRIVVVTGRTDRWILEELRG